MAINIRKTQVIRSQKVTPTCITITSEYHKLQQMAVSSTKHEHKSQRWFRPVLSSWLSSKLTLPRCRTPAMMVYIASLSSSDMPICVMASSVSLKSAMSSIWMSFRLPLCTNYKCNKWNCGKALSSVTQSTNQNINVRIITLSMMSITHFTAENAILH